MQKHSTRFIHYTRPNQEPPEHIKGKDRIRYILYSFDYVLVSNTNDRHLEYKLPPMVTDLIAKTQEETIREYQIDVLMYNAQSKLIIAIEVNGSYHFVNDNAIRKTKMKHRAIEEYLASHDAIVVNDLVYPYKSYNVVAFTTDELYGKYSLDRSEIIAEIFEKN